MIITMERQLILKNIRKVYKISVKHQKYNYDKTLKYIETLLLHCLSTKKGIYYIVLKVANC